jgi:hypothetical protein
VYVGLNRKWERVLGKSSKSLTQYLVLVNDFLSGDIMDKMYVDKMYVDRIVMQKLFNSL